MTKKVCSSVLIVLVSAICLTSVASAQTSWWRTYGGPDDDVGYCGQQTTDGGYTVVAYSSSFGAGYRDIYLIKTDAQGDSLWTRTYGGTDYDEGYWVQQTTDSGYIVAGNTKSFGAGSYDVYLIKTNASGDTLWTRTYGGTGIDYGYSVQQTADGGYVVAGFTGSFGLRGDAYLIRTNASGDTLWTRTYGGGGVEHCASVQQTADGGYILVGDTRPYGAEFYDVYLIKTDSSGDTLWTRTYGGSNSDAGSFAQQTADGGYVVTGSTRSFGPGTPTYYNVYLLRTDAQGDTLWTRTYGGNDSDGGSSVQQTSGGGYVIAGGTSSFGAGNDDVYLVRTDAQGDTLWTRTYGGTNRDVGFSVQQTSDGGYIVAGRTSSFGVGSGDVYLMKTDSLGNVGVAEQGPWPQAMDRKLAATVARNLPPGAVAFDAMGRRVLHPKSGIYFVCAEPQASGRKPLAVRKVLLVE